MDESKYYEMETGRRKVITNQPENTIGLGDHYLNYIKFADEDGQNLEVESPINSGSFGGVGSHGSLVRAVTPLIQAIINMDRRIRELERLTGLQIPLSDT